MEKFIGKKRNMDFEPLNDNNIENDIKDKEVDEVKEKNKTNSEMDKLIDDCFNDFMNGNTNKLFENYNLLKQKFYELIQD